MRCRRQNSKNTLILAADDKLIRLACVSVSENWVFLLKFSKFRTKRQDSYAEYELSPESWNREVNDFDLSWCTVFDNI